MAAKLLTQNMGSVDRAARAFVIAPVAIGIALGLGATLDRRNHLARRRRDHARHGRKAAQPTSRSGSTPVAAPPPHRPSNPTHERSLARKEGRRWQPSSRS